jgi:multidrug transporter EmrE-like cation transporter
MNKAIGLIIVSVIIGAIGEICIKAAMVNLGPVNFGSAREWVRSSFKILGQPLIWISLPLYGFGFLAWAAALSHLQLSFAYPLMASSYVFNALSAILFFNEPISLLRWIGITVIILGVVLVGLSR